MKRQLYYYFYTRRDTLYNMVNQIHFKCLEYYRNVFDEAFICISIDDINDKELIKDTEELFLNIFGGFKLTFKIIENNSKNNEAKFFYEEILDNLDKLDLVFFAQNVYSCSSEHINYENLCYMIIGLYAISLDDIKNAILPLTNGLFLTSGSYHMCFKNDQRRYLYNFIWFNTKRIYVQFQKNGLNIDFTEDDNYLDVFLDSIPKIAYCTIKNSASLNDYFFYEYDIENLSTETILKGINIIDNIYLITQQYVNNIYEIKNRIIS